MYFSIGFMNKLTICLKNAYDACDILACYHNRKKFTNIKSVQIAQIPFSAHFQRTYISLNLEIEFTLESKLIALKSYKSLLMKLINHTQFIFS